MADAATTATVAPGEMTTAEALADPMALPPLATKVLWIGFAAMAISCLLFYIDFMKQSAGKRRFHAYTTAITGFAATAYLFMATGHGHILVQGRPFFYARYIDWIFTTPLLLLDLAGTAGADTDETIMLVLWDILMILAGLAGGLAQGNGDSKTSLYMWILGCLFYLPIIYSLGVEFPSKADSIGSSAAKTYKGLAGMTVLLWTAYPVVYFFAEYLQVVSINLEVILYGILDVTAKCAFGAILLTSKDSLEQVFSGYSSIS